VLAVVMHMVFRLGNAVVLPAKRRPWTVVPAVGLIIGVIALIFVEVTNHGADEILFSGQESVGPLVSNHASWTVGALLLLIALKGLAYGFALGSWRGGPVFPALMIGAAAGMVASHLPGFDLTPAVAAGMGAATVSVLRLPLSSVILAVLLSSESGPGAGPLVIVGVIVALLVTMALPDPTGGDEAEGEGAPAPGPPQPASATATA
jgi:H+/Cl- antiporter ClcA